MRRSAHRDYGPYRVNLCIGHGRRCRIDHAQPGFQHSGLVCDAITLIVWTNLDSFVGDALSGLLRGFWEIARLNIQCLQDRLDLRRSRDTASDPHATLPGASAHPPVGGFRTRSHGHAPDYAGRRPAVDRARAARNQTRLSRTARATASVRVVTPSLAKMLVTWVWTVRGLMKRTWAISGLECPSTSKRSTSIS